MPIAACSSPIEWSSTRTATACSARCTTPRMRCRTRSCAPGAGSRGSRSAARRRPRGPRGALRAARERRVGLRRRAPVATAWTTRGPAHARGARILGARGGRVARNDGCVRQQRPATRPQGDCRAAPRAEPAGDAERARRARASGDRPGLRRRDGTRRCRGGRRHADRGRDLVNAPVGVLVRRARGRHGIPPRRGAGAAVAPCGHSRQRPARGRLLRPEPGAGSLRVRGARRARPARWPHRLGHGLRDARSVCELRAAGGAAALWPRLLPGRGGRRRRGSRSAARRPRATARAAVPTAAPAASSSGWWPCSRRRARSSWDSPSAASP
jgi:hypothetical protein